MWATFRGALSCGARPPPGSGAKLRLLGNESPLLINLALSGDVIDPIKRDDLGFEVKPVAGPEDEEDGGGDGCVRCEGDKAP